MSYSNGLGNLQHLLGNLATNSAQNSKATDQTTGAKADKSAAPTTTGHINGPQISTTSGLFSKAISGSDVRTEKVAALQQTIAAGTYNIPAGDVASSIIASLLG